jgi:hypothetical protein
VCDAVGVIEVRALVNDDVVRARVRKPSIPLAGNDGIPIRHEVEVELGS